jgi:plasmid stability protein
MTITLTPDDGDLERRLREAAARHGMEAEQFARDLLARTVFAEQPTPKLSEEDRIEHDEDTNPNALAEAIERLHLTPERRAAAIAHTLATYQPRNPPSPGTSGMDRVFGKWPGDETDEQVRAALEAVE